MSESLNRQEPPEENWSQFLNKIDWKNTELTLHAKNDAGAEVSLDLPLMTDIIQKPVRLPDNTTVYKDLDGRLVKRVLLDGSTVDYLFEGFAKNPNKIVLKYSTASEELEHIAYTLKDTEFNYSFVGSMYEANIFYQKAIKGLVTANLEVFRSDGHPLGVIHSNGAEFQFGHVVTREPVRQRELIKVIPDEYISYFGKLNNPHSRYEISPDSGKIQLGTHGIENNHLSAPILGLHTNLVLAGQHFILSNNGSSPLFVYKKGGKKIPLPQGATLPLGTGDRLLFEDGDTLLDIKKVGESYLLTNAKKPTVLQNETPYVVTDIHFSLGNNGTDYEVTNIAGAKVDISPVVNNISGATGEIHNTGSKPIRIVRGSETIQLSPGERTGLENDDLLSYDIENKLRFNHTFEGIVLEMVPFRDKTAGVKVEIEEMETYLLQQLIGDGFADSNLINKHISNNTLEALGFLRLYEIGDEENDTDAYFVHESTNIQLQKFQDRIVEIRMPPRERTSGPNFSELVITIDWYENHVYKISISGKKNQIDVLTRLIPGRRKNTLKAWSEFEIKADESMPYVPDGHILLVKCIKHPSQFDNLDIPSVWSCDPAQEAFEALPDSKVVYVLIPIAEAENFKCLVDEKEKYVLSLMKLDQVREHIFSPENPNNTGDLWFYKKLKTLFDENKSSTISSDPQLLRSRNIDISRFGLILRKPDEHNPNQSQNLHPPFCFSRPKARHRVLSGQIFSAGSELNSEILVHNANSTVFHIVCEKNGQHIEIFPNLRSSVAVIRSGEKLEYQSRVTLESNDEIEIVSTSDSEKCISKDIFKTEINSNAVYLIHSSSVMNVRSITQYANSLDSKFTDFRTAIISKEDIISQLNIETLLHRTLKNIEYQNDSNNDLDFNPLSINNPYIEEDIIWVSDPLPYQGVYNCIIHHTVVDFERQAQVIPYQEGMIDIGIIAGAEKVAFLRSTSSEEEDLEYWLVNPYGSDELLLLAKDQTRALPVEGGPGIKLCKGDTFFINQHAFTLASVDEFENFEFFNARLDSKDESNNRLTEKSDFITLSDLPLTSIEAETYLVPFDRMDSFLDKLPNEILAKVELRMFAGEMIVFCKIPFADDEEKPVFFIGDTTDFPVDVLLMNALKQAREENFSSIAIPILSIEHSPNFVYETIVSHIEGVKLAESDINVIISTNGINSRISELITDELVIQKIDPAYSKVRSDLIMLLNQLNIEISNTSSDLYIPLDTSNALASSIKKLKSALAKVDFSIIDPSILAKDLNEILDILALSGRFVFLLKEVNGRLQFLMKDKISDSHWKDLASIKVSVNESSSFIMQEEKNYALKKFSEALSTKNIYVPDAYLLSIKATIKSLENTGMPATVLEELLNKSFERENIRHQLIAQLKNNTLTIKNRISTSRQAMTVFSIDTGVKTETAVLEIKKSDSFDQKSENSAGEGLSAVNRMKDFLSAESAKRVEERISLETKMGPVQGVVLLRQQNLNIVIVKLDQPIDFKLIEAQIPSWKQYSELATFHFAGRSYRYNAEGIVFTAVKGIIEISEDLYAHNEESFSP